MAGKLDKRAPAFAEVVITLTSLTPFAGQAVKHLDAEEGTRIRAAYSHGYERLVALKNKYDPTNLFRLNQNIKPTV